MAASGHEQVPPELIRSWARYIEPSHKVTFEQNCAAASLQTIDEVLLPFFAEWSISLIGSDLAQLKSLAEDERLRCLVRRLVIEDGCEKLDPWMTGDVPQVNSSIHVWPRNDTETGRPSSSRYQNGIVTAGELDDGITALVEILCERKLRPARIVIRDYQIMKDNFRLCPEMARLQELIQVASPTTKNAVSVDGLAKRIVERSNLAVSCLKMRSVDMGFFSPASWDLLVSKFGGFMSLGVPKAEEATIELFEDYEGQEATFKMLRSADVHIEHDAAAYWLEQIFYRAPSLETLSLTVQRLPSRWLAPNRVVPKLQEFTLSQTQTAISAEDLLAMMSSSKASLTHLHFRSVTLTGNSWRNVLSFIANQYRSLRSFKLDRLREGEPAQRPSFTLDFSDARDHVPEAYRPGLTLIEKTRFPHKPVASLTYAGSDAGPVLDILASKGKPGIYKRLGQVDYVVN